jgi:hypothetical protein
MGQPLSCCHGKEFSEKIYGAPRSVESESNASKDFRSFSLFSPEKGQENKNGKGQQVRKGLKSRAERLKQLKANLRKRVKDVMKRKMKYHSFMEIVQKYLTLYRSKIDSGLPEHDLLNIASYLSLEKNDFVNMKKPAV